MSKCSRRKYQQRKPAGDEFRAANRNKHTRAQSGIHLTSLSELMVDYWRSWNNEAICLQHLAFCSDHREAILRYQRLCYRIQCCYPRYIYRCYDGPLCPVSWNEMGQLSQSHLLSFLACQLEIRDKQKRIGFRLHLRELSHLYKIS